MHIYAELDCLLDTRLGTLAVINPAMAEEAITGGRYYHRLTDNLWDFVTGLTKEQWLEAYEWRGRDSINKAKQTQIYKLMNDVLFPEYDKYVRNITDTLPTVTVNVYPYELTDSFKEALETVLANILITPEIKVVRTNPEKLPPQKIGRSYTHLWMYDFDRYFKPFYQDIGNHPGVPGVFHFPAIARGEGAEHQEHGVLGNHMVTLSEGLAGYLNVSFEPPYNYSFHLHTTPFKEDGEVSATTPEEEEVEVRRDQ